MNFEGFSSTAEPSGSLNHSMRFGMSVRVRLPGAVARAINPPCDGGWFYDPTALQLGLQGFVPPTGYKAVISKPVLQRSHFGKEWRVGQFKLGTQFKTDHVVRECLGEMPLEESWRRSGGDTSKLSFLEKLWKPVHSRVGLFPLRDKPLRTDPVADQALQRVHWCAPERTAHAALTKLCDVKRSPGIRKLSEAPAGARLRRRARWVLQMNPDKNSLSLGRLLKGWWTPDLTSEFADGSSARLVAAYGDVVKFLGGGIVKKSLGVNEKGEERFEELVFVNAVHEGTVFQLYPELLARLGSYATYRKRSSVLVTALRSRALEWCKKMKFTMEETLETVAPSVALAYFPSKQEQAGQALFKGLTSGRVADADGWWNAGD